jgi:hypothetical protein
MFRTTMMKTCAVALLLLVVLVCVAEGSTRVDKKVENGNAKLLKKPFPRHLEVRLT